MRITPVRAAIGSVGAVLIATGLLIALDPADPTGGGKAAPPKAAPPTAAPPRVVPARPPGSTIELTAQGLRIDFAASSDVLIRHWRPAARSFGFAEQLPSGLASVTVLPADVHQRRGWSVVHERVGDVIESSLVTIPRRPPDDGLLPLAARVWPDRVELTWQFEAADFWTIRRNGEPATPVRVGSFIDRRGAGATGVRYEINGELKPQNVGEDRISTVSYVMVLAPGPSGDAPAMEEDHEWASYFNIGAGE